VNKKQFRSALTQYLTENVPDVLNRINLDSIPSTPQFSAPSLPLRKTAWMHVMKLTTIAFLLVVSGFFAFSQKAQSTPVFASSSDIVAFQAVSAVDLLREILLTTSPTANPLSDEHEPHVGDQIDQLNSYLNMLELFLGNSAQITSIEQTSDLSEYSHLLVYQSTSLTNRIVTYKIYYNELLTNQINWDNVIFSDSFDESVTSMLEGIVMIGTKQFGFETKVYMSEGNPSYAVRTYETAQDYVSVIYSTDTDGNQKFFYDLVHDGQLLHQSKIYIQNLSDSIYTTIDFIQGDVNGQYTLTQKTMDTFKYIDVTYVLLEGTHVIEQGQMQVNVLVDPITGLTEYSYAIIVDGDDIEHEYIRDREDHEDEEDDHEDDDQEDDDQEDDDQEDDDQEDDDQEDDDHSAEDDGEDIETEQE